MRKISLRILIAGLLQSCSVAPVFQHAAGQPLDNIPKLEEGVYSMCDEVAGYSGEVVELKDGMFRYWFYSDVNNGQEPEYPLSGNYKVSGDTLTSRARSEEDRRIVVVRIAPSGMKLLAALDSVVQGLHRNVLGPLGEKKLRLMVELSEEMRSLV
jgi:hypothetical protein